MCSFTVSSIIHFKPIRTHSSYTEHNYNSKTHVHAMQQCRRSSETHERMLLRMKRSQSVSQQLGDRPSSDNGNDPLVLTHAIFPQQQHHHHHHSSSASSAHHHHSGPGQHLSGAQSAALLNNNTHHHLTSPNASNASTPTTVHPYAPLQSPTLSMSTTSK